MAWEAILPHGDSWKLRSIRPCTSEQVCPTSRFSLVLLCCHYPLVSGQMHGTLELGESPTLASPRQARERASQPELRAFLTAQPTQLPRGQVAHRTSAILTQAIGGGRQDIYSLTMSLEFSLGMCPTGGCAEDLHSLWVISRSFETVQSPLGPYELNFAPRPSSH